MSGEAPNRATTVLVTGAGGFIGSHLAADQLRRGRRVVAVDLSLDRVHHLAAAGSFELVEGDVTDERVLARGLDGGVQTVFHLAAAHLAVGPAQEFWRVNVEGLRTLARLCQERRVGRLVHCSSVGVHGTVERPPANEDSPCRPDIPYEVTKLEGERLLLRAHATERLPVVLLRPVWVYGPGCPRTEKLFRAVGRRRFVVAGRGDTRRHCVYIRDMLEAFERAAISPDALGATIIVGDAQAVTVRGLVDRIARLTSAPPPRRVPLTLLRAVALLAEAVARPLGKEPPLSRRTLKFFTSNTAFDTSRAERLLGFRPRYDVAAGLEETWRLLQQGRFWSVPLPDPAGE